MRNAVSIGIPFAITPWIQRNGLQNMFVACGFISFGVTLTIIPMVVWGKAARRALAGRYRSIVEEHGHAGPQWWRFGPTVSQFGWLQWRFVGILGTIRFGLLGSWVSTGLFNLCLCTARDCVCSTCLWVFWSYTSFSLWQQEFIGPRSFKPYIHRDYGYSGSVCHAGE
jgi:hypothetical protein